MSKRKRAKRDTHYHNWESKPMTWNTKSRWQQHGYRPRQNMTPCGVLYNKFGKACDLFNKHQVEIIPGKAAALRRAELHFAIARGVMCSWADGLFTSDEQLQDTAIAYSQREFVDWWNMPIELSPTRRDMLRFEFEKEVCRLMERDYADYAYCETF